MQNDAESMAQVRMQTNGNIWKQIAPEAVARDLSRLGSSNCRSCRSRKDNMQQKISLSSVMESNNVHTKKTFCVFGVLQDNGRRLAV